MDIQNIINDLYSVAGLVMMILAVLSTLIGILASHGIINKVNAAKFRKMLFQGYTGLEALSHVKLTQLQVIKRGDIPEIQETKDLKAKGGK